MAHGPYDEAVDRLIANGYSPLALSGKHPIEIEWPRRWCERPTPEQIAERKGRGHNIGIATGDRVVAIDIDTDDATINDALRRAVPGSNVIKRGQTGSTGFYRVAGAVPAGRAFRGKDGQILVELLSDGRQAVVPPSVHPDTGRPYRWLTTATLLDTPAEQLTPIPADIGDRIASALAPWLGSGDLFPDIGWANRPDMAGSEAPEALQDVWIAMVMAMREVHGTVRLGRCGLLNLAALPLVESVLGEPVAACAGYAMFVVPGHGRLELGARWVPEKWRRYVDCQPSDDILDVHAWLETRTQVIDMTTYQIAARPGLSGAWPPLVCWPKWTLPSNPRDAQGRRTMLVWRNVQALESVMALVGSMVPPITARAMAEQRADV